MRKFKPRATKLAKRLRNGPTEAERKLWNQLSRRQLDGCKFSRQMPVGPYVCDFLCREHKLVVEVDGGQHCDNRMDATRTANLEALGFRVVRFWNNDVLDNIEGVLAVIATVIGDCPPPSPSREREGVRADAQEPLPSRKREGIEGWAIK